MRYNIVLVGLSGYCMKRSRATSDYESLAEVRYQLRRFLHFSEQAARDAGLEPQQHQLMLALKGLPEGTRPRVGELAERLQIRHHSAVELIDRLSSAGLVRRHTGGEDRREVLIALTARGERILRELSLHHRAELRKRGPALIGALKLAMATTGAKRTAVAGGHVGKKRVQQKVQNKVQKEVQKTIQKRRSLEGR
jgi:DNA-binding MarR family transcriptional regulator